MTHNTENMIRRAGLRSDAYALLASLLVRPPAPDRMRQLAGLSAAAGTPARLAEALQRLKEAGARADAESVQREYGDLFIGLGRGEILPYASWYGEKLLMAAPLARLRTDLSALNIERRPGVCEPEDHAGALCEIMVLIIAQPEISLRRQAEFFRAHLAWMSDFFRDLQAARTAGFYRAVGRLGEQFMRLEEEFLHEHVIEEV